jgi:hypothetical protein
MFQSGDVTVRTAELIEHPQFNSLSLANDIAIMVLEEAIDTIAPSLIHRERPLVGEMLTLVGYGDGGTTFNPVRDFPTKRVGQTPVETITANQLRWTFNGHGESNTATGDSGGPAFVERDGSLFVAGITSGGDGDPWNRNGDIDHAWETRVDVFASWIDAIVAGETPDPPPDEHPDEPAIGAEKIRLVGGHGWASGKLQENGDRDAFQFRLAEEASVSVTVTSIDGSLDSELRLYNAAGQLVQSNDDIVAGDNTNSRIIRTLPAGTHFITVGAFDDESNGAYSVVIDLGSNPSGDQHADVPRIEATLIALDSDGHAAISGRLESDRDHDVFAFTLNRSTPVAVAAAATDGRLDAFLSLYDAEGILLESNDDGPVPTDSLIETELPAGTYYASVASYEAGSSGTYVLSLQVTPEPVDLFADLAKVTLDRFGRVLLEGEIAESGGFAVYTFVSRFTGAITAVTRAADHTIDTRLVVFDSSKNELAAANDRSLTNLNSLVKFDVVENRRYYVVVEGEAGTTGDFWLTIRTSFGAKEKAVEGLPDASAIRRSGKVREPGAKAALPPAAVAQGPQLLPAKAAGARSIGRIAIADWRS